jgi:bifunctional non-homologous end joining protein LigD
MRTKENNNAGTANPPKALKPMLTTLVKQPFDDEDYVFEVKWDGYRIIAYCHGETVKLQSRGGEDYTKKYPSVAKALRSIGTDCILDGEVIYMNDKGKPDFDALQKVNGQTAPIVYMAFDILWHEGTSLLKRPLLERKEILQEVVADNDVVRFSDHFTNGLELFEQVKNLGLEGIVAKHKHSAYNPGERSKKWLKVTTEHRQEFVIGGWIESEKRETFRTLLFGVYDNGKLKWKGHAGSGFKERDMRSILERLKKIEISENPFDSEVEYSEGKPHWVRPELVANIKYATTTRSGKIRKPAIFLGFREDKRPDQVEGEEATGPPHAGDVKNSLHRSSGISTKAHGGRKKNLPTTADSNWPIIEREPKRNRDVFHLESCDIEVHNVEQELWKGITKARLIEYYNSIAPVILPHLRQRPLTLHVKLHGPNAKGLYIKDMEGRQPECADIFTIARKHKKEGKRDVIDYLVCNNTPTLLYMINLGCIDVNPWTSNISTPEHPDFMVIDLDPSDGDFGKAIETAKAAKEFFDEHKLKAFSKTSGKTGIHCLIPCTAFSFVEARRVAEHICAAIHQSVPSITTTEVSVAQRGTKLYLDPNQNDFTDTVACAYSVRPFKHPNVSTPLDWKEINSNLAPEAFTINTIDKRLRKKGDLFSGVLDRTIAIKNDKALKRLV